MKTINSLLVTFLFSSVCYGPDKLYPDISDLKNIAQQFPTQPYQKTGQTNPQPSAPPLENGQQATKQPIDYYSLQAASTCAAPLTQHEVELYQRIMELELQLKEQKKEIQKVNDRITDIAEHLEFFALGVSKIVEMSLRI